MDILAALSLIFGVPILIAGAIEFGKGEVTGFMVMLCGCFAIYNGASYFLSSNDNNQEVKPVDIVIEKQKECLPIAKAEYLNVYGFLDIRYQKCDTGEIEIINESEFTKLVIPIDEKLVSKREINVDILDKIVLPSTFVIFFIALLGWFFFKVFNRLSF